MGEGEKIIYICPYGCRKPSFIQLNVTVVTREIAGDGITVTKEEEKTTSTVKCIKCGEIAYTKKISE
jgi:hypothetical protein